jgi:hypothetical protein
VKKIFLILFLIFTFISNSFAQECLWHAYAYSGYAWCKKTGFNNPDRINPEGQRVFIFDPNLNDDNVLRNAPFGGMALHRSVNSWLRLGFSFDSYATFAYQKFHTVLLPAALVEVLWDQYQRQFSLQHRSAMFDCYLQTPASWQVTVGAISIIPQIGGSVGVGINNMYNFQTITHNIIAQDTDVTTIGANHISKSLAWRIEAGIKFNSLESNVSFGVSYRYYCGGEFKSGTRFMFNDISNEGTIYNLPAWRGVLKTNQIKLYINANFD